MYRIKQWLVTLPVGSTRYRFVTYIWGEERVSEARACNFYWVMAPLSTLAYILLGALWLFGKVIINPIGWFFGYASTDVKDVGPGRYKTGKHIFYPRLYNPRSANYNERAPVNHILQYVLPWVIVGLMIWIAYVGIMWTIILWLARYWLWIVGVLGAGVLFYLIGRAVANNRGWFRDFYEDHCPPLEIMNKEPTEA